MCTCALLTANLTVDAGLDDDDELPVPRSQQSGDSMSVGAPETPRPSEAIQNAQVLCLR